MKFVECEDCKCELEVDDIDTANVSAESGADACIVFLGHCPECGQNYTWSESFDYTMFSGLRKDE
jgi:hypothetical protein